MARTINVSDFLLADTLESGQAFRWYRAEDGWFTGVVGKRVLRLRQSPRRSDFQSRRGTETIANGIRSYQKEEIPAVRGSLTSHGRDRRSPNSFRRLEGRVNGEVGRPAPNSELAIGNRSYGKGESTLELECHPSSDADLALVLHYLGLDESLQKIISTFPNGPHLREAVRRYRGLRLMRQEPWETLASFIASSSKQIVQIRQIVANVCAALGNEIFISAPQKCHPERSEGSQVTSESTQKLSKPGRDRRARRAANSGQRSGLFLPGEILRYAQNDRQNEDGGEQKRFFTFPTPDNVACATHKQLWDCKLGFRAQYLLDTARMIDAGDIDLAAVARMDTPRARKELMRCPGVGEKVANCTLLFGFGRMDAFPIDVWVEKALRELYFRDNGKVTSRQLKEFSASYFGPYAGYAQQYLFHYVRMNPEVLAARQGAS